LQNEADLLLHSVVRTGGLDLRTVNSQRFRKRENGVSPNNLQFSIFPIAATNRRILRPTHLWLN